MLFGVGTPAEPSTSLLSGSRQSESSLSQSHQSQFSGRLPIVLVLVVFAATLFRLIAVVNRYSVNMIFWDQWDFYTPLFNRASLWRIFTWEHAPIREGIGLVLDKFVLDATRWNTRAEALFMVGILVLAAMAALLLKQKLYCRLGYSDVVIPCLFLTFAQLEILIGEENPSYSVFPELLLILYCLAWTISKPILRYASVLLLNFLLIFTGFGFFMGLVTIGILLLDLRREFRASGSLRLSAVALVLAIVSQASFFYRYQWSTEITCPIFGAHFWQYPWFMGLMMAYFFGLRTTVAASILGGSLALIAVAVLAWHLWRLWRDRGWSPIDVTVVILLAYTLLFQANTALGRVCLGLPWAAQFSRYMGLLVPAFLAIYLHVLTWRANRIRTAAQIVFALALVPSTLLIPAGYSPQTVHDGKAAWRACILQTGQIDYCDRTTSFPVYPFPRKTHLLEKLQFLQQNQLNLYSGER